MYIFITRDCMQIHKAWFWITVGCKVLLLAGTQMGWSDFIWNSFNYSRRDSFLSSRQANPSYVFKLPLQPMERSRLRSETHCMITHLWAATEGGVPSHPIHPIALTMSLSTATGMSRMRAQHTACLHGGMQDHAGMWKHPFWWQFRFLLHKSICFNAVNNVWNELYCL